MFLGAESESGADLAKCRGKVGFIDQSLVLFSKLFTRKFMKSKILCWSETGGCGPCLLLLW